MAQVTMPHLGESVSEGTIGRWLKQPGERIEKYEPLVEVTTDKVNTEMPSPFTGILQEITVEEGTVVKIGDQIAVINTEESGAEAAPPADAPATLAPPPEAEAASEPAATSGPAGSDESWPEEAAAPVEAVTAQVASDGPRRYTPVVLRLVEQHGISADELRRIPGTGLGGRVSKNDLLRYIESHGKEPVAAEATAATAVATKPAPAAAPAPQVPPQPPPSARPSDGEADLVPLTPMRRAIAEHMVRSVATSPHAWTMMEVDMTGAVRLRARHKDDFQAREGYGLSYVPFMIEAVVGALHEYPALNASWEEGGIRLKREINIGVAVALPDGAGLLVPVIRNADGLNFIGLARAVQDLATRARTSKLTPDDLAGGTFTVNNPGSFGSVLSQPIINQPQAAIVTMEAIIKRPIVVTDPESGDDLIAIRHLMNICLSFDHRLLDGLTAGQFLASIKRRLEALGSRTSL